MPDEKTGQAVPSPVPEHMRAYGDDLVSMGELDRNLWLMGLTEGTKSVLEAIAAFLPGPGRMVCDGLIALTSLVERYAMVLENRFFVRQVLNKALWLCDLITKYRERLGNGCSDMLTGILTGFKNRAQEVELECRRIEVRKKGSWARMKEYFAADVWEAKWKDMESVLEDARKHLSLAVGMEAHVAGAKMQAVAERVESTLGRVEVETVKTKEAVERLEDEVAAQNVAGAKIQAVAERGESRLGRLEVETVKITEAIESLKDTLAALKASVLPHVAVAGSSAAAVVVSPQQERLRTIESLARGQLTCCLRRRTEHWG